MVKIKTAKNVSLNDLEVLTRIYFESFKEAYGVKRLTNHIKEEVLIQFCSPKTVHGLIAYEKETPVGFTTYTEIFSNYLDLMKTVICRRNNRLKKAEVISELDTKIIDSVQTIKIENEQLCSSKQSKIIYPTNKLTRFYEVQDTDIIKIATAVDPACRRRGIASSINSSLEKKLASSKSANQIFTMCRANQPIIKLNLNAGYSILAEVTNFYNNRESCILLGKTLQKY